MRRHHGSFATGAAATSGFPQVRQKWRVGSLGEPQFAQMMSPGFATITGAGVTGVAGRGGRGTWSVGRRFCGWLSSGRPVAADGARMPGRTAGGSSTAASGDTAGGWAVGGGGGGGDGGATGIIGVSLGALSSIFVPVYSRNEPQPPQNS